ncbi:MAG TPA: sulfatase-like hydrolase/transferase [Phycisphaerae bacterium]|nr:sulfatase-like hydrolase/transferase [Phycisphaerae bacterium]HOJ75119.1 sulfatase-like hydrolase/transferase [Phycisphaerae bacterium]HOM52349.1 sulfatase-like hydrolase/transferase [Phycisphaerae bacterium]HON68585.1 sulfatase-like hydrolase/transferase [Phycisphaerae bacterium]HOQ86702.1 sulfatase-like hydrolase/transferase [Phycisphaerae bacterium]
MRRIVLAVLGGWVLLGQMPGALAAGSNADERPNFLFILADDLGKEWLSCYGSETHRTPNIDRLAESGVRFENVWATPLCTPTRHELLTGRYPFRTGWTVHNDVPRWGEPCFHWDREYCLVRSLREAGYATAISGKWQINDLRTHPDALARHGFDEHCVWPGFETGNPPAAERYFNPFLQINGKRQTQEGKFGPDLLCDFTIEFMKRHKDRPFFAYHAMVLPHPPMTRTPANRDTTATGVALYPGMVDYVDGIVGRLVSAVKELGIERRTVVVFAADNGSPGLRARMRGLDVVGGKTQLTEPGICVPFMVCWPGQFPAGVVSHELVDFTDVLPTILDLAGIKPPAGVTLDGRSFASALRRDATAGGTREWIFSQLGENRVIRDKRYKLWSDGRFFDLQADPLERQDLSGSELPAHQAAREKLQRVLDSLPADQTLPFVNRPKGQ